MNITINDIRTYGNRIIYNYFMKVTDGKFWDKVNSMVALLNTSKLAPYGAINYWDAISILSAKECGGLKKFMLETAPYIEAGQVDTADKRRFRTAWETMWVKFVDSCDIGNVGYSGLSDVGLKLPLLISALDYKNTLAIKGIKLAQSHLDRLGITYEDYGVEYLYNHFDDIRLLCEFYNTVICWHLSVQSERETGELLSFLVLHDTSVVVDNFKNGDVVWVPGSEYTERSSPSNVDINAVEGTPVSAVLNESMLDSYRQIVTSLENESPDIEYTDTLIEDATEDSNKSEVMYKSICDTPNPEGTETDKVAKRLSNAMLYSQIFDNNNDDEIELSNSLNRVAFLK